MLWPPKSDKVHLALVLLDKLFDHGSAFLPNATAISSAFAEFKP